MLKDKVDNIKKALVKVEKKDNKKSIENLLVFAVILIITIIAINYIWKGDKKSSNSSNNVTSNVNIIKETSKNEVVNNDLESRLTDILGNINGVGEVKVLITYAETSEINPVYNEDSQESVTEETDTSGGKRIISSETSKKEVVYSDNNIITKSIKSPQIQGAVIIAKGANNSKVKSDIIQAVAAATGLSTYKIQVFEMN